MQDLFTRHPLPWTCDQQPSFDAYFVRDANKGTVAIISSVDETVEYKTEDNQQVRIVYKRPRQGAQRLAKLVTELPVLLELLAEAQSEIGKVGGGWDPMAGKLEAMLERLTS